MAMEEGVVTIDPGTGDVLASTGAAGVVFDYLNGVQDYAGLTGPYLAASREGVARVARGLAKLVPYIQQNAEVSVQVTGTITQGPGSKAIGVTVGSANVDIAGETTGTGTGGIA